MQRKKISWVHLDLAPVAGEEAEEVEEEAGADSPLEVEAVEEDAVASLPVAEAAVVAVAAEDVEAEVAGEGWEAARKLSSNHTDTPGSSLPGGRRTPW